MWPDYPLPMTDPETPAPAIPAADANGRAQSSPKPAQSAESSPTPTTPAATVPGPRWPSDLAPRPLTVRLRNWVGDVTLSLPLLQRLSNAGYALQLVGKPWARDLLAGHGWPVHVLPKTWRERVALHRHLRHEGLQQTGAHRSWRKRTAWPDHPHADRRIDALCLPDSFSSALEFRLAGLHALGHAWESRSWLLGRAVPRQRQVHEFKVYWELGNQLLGQAAALPHSLGLQPSPQHLAQAQALRLQHGISAGCIVICPFAGGTWNQQDKTWPDFPALAAQGLPRLGRAVVLCPGPGEEDEAVTHFPHCHVLSGVDLGTYAALLQDAALMISNDTGPGHMAAAVGTPLVSVMGPSDAALWRAWGPEVTVVQGPQGWPSVDAVMRAASSALDQAARRLQRNGSTPH
jgi:heptosyltransferase-2